MSKVITPPEPDLDAQLDAILEDEGSPKSSDGKPPTPGEPSKSLEEKAPSPDPPEQTSPTEDDLTKKLEAIDETTEGKEAPALSDEQQRILSVFPSAKVAADTLAIAENYSNFANAFEGGDFESVEGMFTEWNPQAYSAFEEHIYQKRVASGEWVDRWIAEKEGNPTVHRGLTALQQKIAALEGQLKQRSERETSVQGEAQARQLAQQYVKHLEGLFDQIEFSKADRRWVAADIHSRVSANPEVTKALRAGNMKAVNRIFKEAVREYVDRDKVAVAKKDATLDDQTKKKLVAPSAPVVVGDEDDLDKVPADQRDGWVDRQLDKLAKLTKRK